MRTKGTELQRNNFALLQTRRGVEVKCLYHPDCRTFGSPYCQLASREIFSTCPLPATLTSTTVTPSRVSEHNRFKAYGYIQPSIHCSVFVGLRRCKDARGE